MYDVEFVANVMRIRQWQKCENRSTFAKLMNECIHGVLQKRLLYCTEQHIINIQMKDWRWNTDFKSVYSEVLIVTRERTRNVQLLFEYEVKDQDRPRAEWTICFRLPLPGVAKPKEWKRRCDQMDSRAGDSVSLLIAVRSKFSLQYVVDAWSGVSRQSTGSRAAWRRQTTHHTAAAAAAAAAPHPDVLLCMPLTPTDGLCVATQRAPQSHCLVSATACRTE